jgi:endonuclease YncB( thermonuclease family)
MHRSLALALLFTTTAASAQPARVMDGDTLDLAGQRIRIWGIDAAEGDQICQRGGHLWQCGEAAARALETLVHQGGIKCTEVDHDEYGHTVATCVVNGRDVGSDMVRSGWALDYAKYSRGAYLGEQLDAIQAQRGLWAGSFMPPWEWRAR